jgi:hypothetical protein
MPEVYNWQLGRMATYVYDEKHPKEQFTFVLTRTVVLLVRPVRWPINLPGPSRRVRSICGGTM